MSRIVTYFTKKIPLGVNCSIDYFVDNHKNLVLHNLNGPALIDTSNVFHCIVSILHGNVSVLKNREIEIPEYIKQYINLTLI